MRVRVSLFIHLLGFIIKKVTFLNVLSVPLFA